MVKLFTQILREKSENDQNRTSERYRVKQQTKALSFEAKLSALSFIF